MKSPLSREHKKDRTFNVQRLSIAPWKLDIPCWILAIRGGVPSIPSLRRVFITNEGAEFNDMFFVDAARVGLILLAERRGVTGGDAHLAGGLHDARSAESDV